MSEEYLCKDCKHSFMTIHDLLFGTRQYSMKCRLNYKEEEVKIDFVVGPEQVPGKYQSCQITRFHSGPCGQEGRMWAPKKKTDLFKLIRKD